MEEALINKIGNSMIYLSNHCEGLHNKTHFLKMIYILDEESVKETGVPFFNLNYQIWQYGPVDPQLFNLATNNSEVFDKFIKIVKGKLKPVAEFNDDEFSNNDLKILEKVCDRFKYCTTTELVNHTHKPSSPWYIIAKQNNLLDAKGDLKRPTTEIEIDFSILLENSEEKLFRYNLYKDSF